MKKGKASALIVLVLEITAITVLHAVKINHSEKAGNKEVSRTISSNQPESKIRSSIFSLAVYK
jgi:hypothetical protein